MPKLMPNCCQIICDQHIISIPSSAGSCFRLIGDEHPAATHGDPTLQNIPRGQQLKDHICNM